jgi:hypothetical protein
MGNAAQKKAIRNYRARLSERGLHRFEILALETDGDLIRSLARRLAEAGPEAEHVRTALKTAIAGTPPTTGGILAALRRSPLVDANLDLSRSHEEGRRVDL